MNPIESQRQLIDKLYHLIRESITCEYDIVTCRFDYPRFDDGSSSIGAKLLYMCNGEEKSGVLRYPDRQILGSVIPELHAQMKAHTGGDWSAFTLTIKEDGRVTTKFEYPEQEE